MTGVSIASAAAFSRIAYPEMKAFGYDRGFALGAIAGSSCLGMLIPPSVLMIVWGILTEQSIGRLFLAGVLPGLMLASLFLVYIIVVALRRPGKVGESGDRQRRTSDAGTELTSERELSSLSFLSSLLGMGFIITAVLGGIWKGIYTPTEGAGAGAALALIFAIMKGMRWRQFVEAVYTVGKTAAPILILLLAAALYSRTLAMTGVTNAIRETFVESGMDPWMVLTVIIMIWFVLGMFVDSISIMLLTVPIVEPIAVAFGYDRMAFAIIGILAIEAGLLTPPFGLLVYTVKAAIQDDDVGVQRIFMSSIPYWGIMLFGVVLIILFPKIASFLPEALM